MTVFQLFSDKRKSFVLHFVILFLLFSLFFCISNWLSNKYIVRNSFFVQNGIQTLVKTQKSYDNIGNLYIVSTGSVEISTDFQSCEVLMQTKTDSNIEERLAASEIIITDELAKKRNLKVGDKVQVKKITESDFNSYVVKNIIHDPYLKLREGVFEFDSFVFLPYDASFEKNTKAAYAILCKEKFSELSNDVKTNTKYLLTKDDITKEVIFVHISLFCLIFVLYVVIYSIAKNIFHENLYRRIYNLFNLGQKKNENIFILFSLIFFIQWLPMELANLFSYIISLDTYLIFETFVLNTCFNTLISFIIFCVNFYKDMRQGRTSLL